MRKTVQAGARATALVLLTLAGPPLAAQTTGSLQLDSEAGDSIGQGQHLAFDSQTASFSAYYDGSLLTVNVFPFAGGFWTVQLAAPPGQPLEEGAYESAVRATFRPLGVPGIDVTGDGRGCNMTFGRFDVTEAVFGASNYVERFAASFEQHCESETAPALFGVVEVQNPPPPPPLQIAVDVLNGFTNRVTGAATLQGSVSCSTATDVAVNGTLTQRVTKVLVARGSFFLSVPCTAPGVAWEAQVSDSSGLAFLRRPAEVALQASAFDPAYGSFVIVNEIRVVRLTKPAKE